MLLRIWPNPDPNAQKPGPSPSSAGIIDLAGDFKTERVHSIPQFKSSLTYKYYALEWAGYVRIDKEDTYVITTELSATDRQVSAHLYLNGNRIINIGNIYNAGTKSAIVKLSPGYHPLSLFTVQTGQYTNAMSCKIKIYPKSELDGEPLKVSDFYFRKK